MIGIFLQAIGLGACCALEKYRDNKRAKAYYSNPINIIRAQRAAEVERDAHRNIVEIMAKQGMIIDTKTGIDQNGKKWWVKNHTLGNWGG